MCFWDPFPKIDLHCHLDGSLCLEFMREALAYSSMSELSRAVQAPATCGNLGAYLEKFRLPLQCLHTAEHIRQAARTFLLSLVPDGIVYVEVRFSPAELATPELSIRDVLDLVLAGLRDGQQECSILFGVILCAMRGDPPEKNMEIFSLAKEYLTQGVCAVDLAGDEALYPQSEFQPLFFYARDNGIPFTVHAGECGSAENIVDALQMGAKRIGHGLAMAGKPNLQRFCAEHHIGIELCPTSNFQTGAVSSIGDYPIREFMENGILVTVNTDNRTISNTTIGREWEFLRRCCHFSQRELLQVTKNAIAVSFADEDVKRYLTTLVQEYSPSQA